MRTGMGGRRTAPRCYPGGPGATKPRPLGDRGATGSGCGAVAAPDVDQAQDGSVSARQAMSVPGAAWAVARSTLGAPDLPRNRVRLRLVLAAVAAAALAACQLRLATDIAVDADLQGSFEVAVALDAELTRILRDAGVDVLAGFDELRADAPGWTVQRQEPADGGVEVRARARFDGSGDFAVLAASLHEALDEDDARLFEDLRLRRLDGGPVAFDGAVGLVLPAAPGARGAGVGFDRDDLQRLLASRGDELVRYDMRVTLPAPPRRHDADRVEGRSLTWRAPVGELRPVMAVSEDPGPGALALALVAVVAAVMSALLVTAVRRWWRRGSARRSRPAAGRANRATPAVGMSGSAPVSQDRDRRGG